MIEYLKITQQAGYKGDTAVYIARKISEKQVPKHRLNNLNLYFKSADTLAGVPIQELGINLQNAADAPKPKPKVKKVKPIDSGKDKENGNS